MQQQQQQQQQPPSQRNSFFRANRPGNLNITNDVTCDSSIQQQQQQLPTYTQQPLSASYSNSYNNQANYSSAQQTNLNSPHYIPQSQISPSYSVYQGQYQSSKLNYEQSFTPKYSPGPSSAHIANNQNYFNFDVPAKPSNTQIPQSPGPVQIQNKYNQLPGSPHLSNQAKNLPLPVATAFSSQNPRYQANYQSFSTSYQNPPHTPVSAISYQSYSSIQSQHLNHSLSVPSSPIQAYKPNHHSIQNQHSIFQFNTVNSNLANTNSNNNCNNLNNGSNLNIKNNNTINNTNNNNNNKNNNNINSQNSVPNFNNFYPHNNSVETSRRVVASDSFEFNPVDVNSSLEEFKQPSQTDTNDNMINASTYNENDVDMVHEVINNFIQKEESIKLSPKGFIISNETSSSSGSNPNSNMNTSNSFGDNFEINFEPNSNHKDTSMDMLDINNNPLSESSKTVGKSNIDGVTSAASRILNPEQKMSESKQFAYSLTNLSEAASAEFLLNYGAENSKLKSKNGENELSEKAKVLKKSTKSTGKDMFSNSPQSFDETFVSNVGEKLKAIDCAVVQGNSSIQTCPDCGKVFTNKSALAKHRLIHSNERKYSCHLCDKSFKRQDHLNGHLMTHSDKKPFVCRAPGCDKSYCDSRSLKRHVESQHQDFLAQLAHGNKDALNYLPSIGKIKANVAPNFQHEISVQDLIKNKVAEIKKDQHQQYSPITPVPGQVEDSKAIIADLNLNNSRPKNFFTFEEPKPETCKICGKGFKNIPALNGHMRLHGGFIKTKLGVRSISELANSDSNTSQSQQSSQNLHIAQPLSNSSFLFNEDSMSSNCSSNNSLSSNISSNNKKMSQCAQQSNLIPVQLSSSENYSKPKSKDKMVNEKEVSSNKTSYFVPNQQFYLTQNSEQNKKINGKTDFNEKLTQGSATNLIIPPKPTIDFQLSSSSNTGQSYQCNFLDQNFTSELPKQNEIYSNSEQSHKPDSKENQTDTNLFSRILTNAFINQAATAAAMVAAAMNHPQTQNNLAKPKPKPMPLIIPQAISAFQKTSYQRPSFYPQFSNGSFMPYIYPNATLLKSPRLFDTDTKKQYTPPPMLSPFRKGPGLFYNPKNINNLFSIQNLLNNKVSGSSNVPFSFNYNHEYGLNNEWHRNEEQLEIKNNNLKITNEKAGADEEFEVVQSQSEKHSRTNRSKLLNQQSVQTGAFFPEDSVSNETIAASLIEESKNTKPFINLGSDFQALIPEFKEKIDQEYLSKSEPEDLMWSSEIMEKLDSHQLSNYLNLICKSSLVFGSSNNLELGLHILNFFDGNIKSSIKAFLDETVELPVNHPITTYKYTETDIWTTEEIKKFEIAILKHDKVFSEIANEVETKSIMQCIEFYYLWKKVMSDNTKKKWKTLKRRRSFDETIEQNLRSSSNGKNDLPNENESGETCLKNNEQDFDDQLDEVDFANAKNYLKESQKNRLGVDENSKSRLSTPSPSQFGFDREKYNQGSAIKRKLNQHIETKQ